MPIVTSASHVNLPFRNCRFRLYGCQFRMVLGLTHTFFRGRLCKKCQYFPTLFWPLPLFFSFGFCKEKSLSLPHPCLTPALTPASPLSLGPTNTHPHALWGSFCLSLSGPTKNEKSAERKNPVFPEQESFWALA